jgi:hypothetical protein
MLLTPPVALCPPPRSKHPPPNPRSYSRPARCAGLACPSPCAFP